MQRAVTEHWDDLETPLAARLGSNDRVTWLSPLADDGFAEYRDGTAFRRLGLDRLVPALEAFWPRRGPQWDALGRTSAGQMLLVEAKAHIAEFCSPASGASADSLQQIRQALERIAEALGSPNGAAWHRLFYQYANRLAYLWFLREHGVDAYLVLIGFVGDTEMKGPETAEAWRAAYDVADYAMGLSRNHPLHRYVVHIHPQVRR